MSHREATLLSVFALNLICVLAIGLVGVIARLGLDVGAEDIVESALSAAAVFGGLAVAPWVSRAGGLARIAVGILLVPGLIVTTIGGLNIGFAAITRLDSLAIFFGGSYILGFIAHCRAYRHLIRSQPASSTTRR